MNFLAVLKLALDLLPLIISTMRVLEQQIPQAGQGAVKAEMLRSMLSDVSTIATDVSQKDYGKAFEKALSVATFMMKSTGFFSGKGA